MAGVCICGLLLPSSEDSDILNFRISFHLKLALAFVLGKNVYFMEHYFRAIMQHILIISNIYDFRYDNDNDITTSIMHRDIVT